MNKLCTFCENVASFLIVSVLSLVSLIVLGFVCKAYWLLFLLGWNRL